MLGLVVGSAVSCSSAEFEDRTAIVEIGARTYTFEVDACGLDGTDAFVVGATEGGAVLQAIVGVTEDDPEEGVPEATGITITDDGVDLGAFGAVSWERRDGSGPAPGRVVDARIRGSRVQASGDLATLDEDGNSVAGSEGVSFTLDARCDEL